MTAREICIYRERERQLQVVCFGSRFIGSSEQTVQRSLWGRWPVLKLLPTVRSQLGVDATTIQLEGGRDGVGLRPHAEPLGWDHHQEVRRITECINDRRP